MKKYCVLVAWLTPCAAVAGGLTVEPAQDLSLVCDFEKSCFVPVVSGADEYCSNTTSEVRIDLREGQTLANIVKPNGKNEPGLANWFYEYDSLKYLAVTSGDGAGTSHVTVFPDASAIWTGHFTLNGNVAFSHFGSCEEMD